MNESRDRMRIMHMLLTIKETSAPYNEHCLPWADQIDSSICTFFRSEIVPPKAIRVFEGDGSIGGFFRALGAALRDKEYDIIHVHSPHLGFLLLAGTLRDHRDAVWSSVVTVHDSYQDYKLRNRMLFLPVFARFRRVVCCSESSLESFPRLYKRLAGDRLSLVQNGLDIVRVDRVAASLPKRPRSDGTFTIVGVCRLLDVKNPRTALSAFQEIAGQTSRFVQIGDGPLRQSLMAQTDGAGLAGQIEFTGLIPREQVFMHLLHSDLYVSTSFGEGLPVAVLEAMACGCPVLLSDIPPHREIAADADFIPLVAPGDVGGFAREMARFREMPSAARADIGRQCRELVERRFSLPVMHERYLRVYGEVIREHASREEAR